MSNCFIFGLPVDLCSQIRTLNKQYISINARRPMARTMKFAWDILWPCRYIRVYYTAAHDRMPDWKGFGRKRQWPNRGNILIFPENTE
jgi:hypothetical protein